MTSTPTSSPLPTASTEALAVQPPATVAVLGLGRMGAAIARRLTDEGWAVSGWTRSGRSVPGARAVDDPAAAVTGADVVVLALFDGPACVDVVEEIRRGLSDTTTVVGTSTIDPEEALALERSVRATGAGYVHAPVLGSVGAARSGTLTVVAGGTAYDLERARPLLDCLGDVLTASGVAEAAALKLVAAGALGSALAGIRSGRLHAARLGLDPALALDVLERGPLGGPVRAKRDQIDGSGGAVPADFTVAALAKDLALLAARSPAARPLAAGAHAALNRGDAAADADVAALARPPARRPAVDGLEMADALADVAADLAADEVLAPLRAYVRGHVTGDASHFREAFLPSAHVEGLREGTFVSWSLEEYCSLFAGKPAPDEAGRRRRLESLAVVGSVGTAVMTLEHGADTFTDVFLLVRLDGHWRIGNKAYHREVRTG